MRWTAPSIGTSARLSSVVLGEPGRGVEGHFEDAVPMLAVSASSVELLLVLDDLDRSAARVETPGGRFNTLRMGILLDRAILERTAFGIILNMPGAVGASAPQGGLAEYLRNVSEGMVTSGYQSLGQLRDAMHPVLVEFVL